MPSWRLIPQHCLDRLWEAVQSLGLHFPPKWIKRVWSNDGPVYSGKKVIIIQCDGAACGTADHGKQLREPKVYFSLLSKSWVILTWVLNSKNRLIIRHLEYWLESIKFSSPKHDRNSRVLVKPSPIWDSGLNIIRQSLRKVNWLL